MSLISYLRLNTTACFKPQKISWDAFCFRTPLNSKTRLQKQYPTVEEVGAQLAIDCWVRKIYFVHRLTAAHTVVTKRRKQYLTVEEVIAELALNCWGDLRLTTDASDRLQMIQSLNDFESSSSSACHHRFDLGNTVILQARHHLVDYARKPIRAKYRQQFILLLLHRLATLHTELVFSPNSWSGCGNKYHF